MRATFSLVSAIILCLTLSGCSSIRPQCSIGLNGQIVCGVDIPLDQAGGAVIGGTVTVPATRSYRALDECGNTRVVTRAVDPCGNTRALSVGDVVTYSPYGRAFTGLAVATRGMTTYNPRALGIYARDMHRDIKREAHNASVLRSYTPERSMWSWVKGKVFNYHDKLCLLDGSLQVDVPVGNVVVDTPAEQLPNIDPGLPPSGIIPPPETKSVNTAALVWRVEQLETRVDKLDAKIDNSTATILAAIAAKK